MADDINILQEFLVALGFKIDDAGLARMRQTLGGITRTVAEIGAAWEAAAAAVDYAVIRMSSSMEKLYFASARTHTSVENIKAFSFAAAQLGSSAEAAQGSLENFANFLRSSPGAAGMLQALGVQVYGANGQQRQATDVMADLGKKFAQMPIAQAQAYASRIGIDQNTLFAMINGLGQLEQAYRKMYAAAGLGSDGGSAAAHGLMIQVRELGAAFEILGMKIAGSLAGPVGDDIEEFRKLIVANFGTITAFIDGFAKIVAAVGLIIGKVMLQLFQLGEQVFLWFSHLNPAGQRFIEILGGITLAWRLLNLSFLESPLGVIIALAAGLLLLYNDYETWKKGGKSLIDWSKWGPEVKLAKQAFEMLGGLLTYLLNNTQAVQAGMVAFFGAITSYWIIHLIAGLVRVLSFIGSIGAKIAQISRAAMGLGKSAATAVEDAGASAAGAAENAAADAGSGGLIGDFGAAIARVAGGAAAGVGLYFDMPGSAKGEAPLQEADDLGKYNIPGQEKAGPNMGDAQQIATAKAVRDTLVNQYGWSQAAADGIVADMMAESGLDPTATGDGGSAYGIGQWHDDRQEEFKKIFGKPIQGSTLGEQVAFYNAELRGGVGAERGSSDAGAKKAGTMLGAPGMTANQAAQIVSRFYERPKAVDEAARNRGALADQLSAKLGNVSPPASGGAPVTQHNTTTINVPSTATAKQLADKQAAINKQNARNLNTPLNRSN